MKQFNAVTLCVILTVGSMLTCNNDSGEINQKTITALPSNQKSGLPEVSSIQPVDAATSISIGTTIAIAFGTKVNVASVEANFSVKRISDNSVVTGSFVWNQGTSFVFTPATNLYYNTNFRVSVSGKTAVGNDLVPYTSTFKTANDGTTPTVISSAPSNGIGAGDIVISIDWSELMNETIVTTTNCTFDGLPCNLANLNWSDPGLSPPYMLPHSLRYSANVACSQTHTLSLSYIEDATGTPSSYTKTFTTAPSCNTCTYETGCCGCACVYPPCQPCRSQTVTDCAICGNAPGC